MKQLILWFLFTSIAFADSILAPINTAIDDAITDSGDISAKLITFFGVIIVIVFAVYIFKETRPK